MRKLHEEKVFSGGHIEVIAAEFDYEDGSKSRREWVAMGACACVLPFDDEYVYLVSQPREATGDSAMLEVPAGGVEEGENPLEAAKRELAEEIGMGADEWELVRVAHTSPGVTDEVAHLYLASELKRVESDGGDDGERTSVVKLPLSHLHDEIARNHDLKTIVLLQDLARRLG